MGALDRRELLGVAAAAAVAPAAAAAPGGGQGPAPGFEARPLPFDPKTVPGLSERLLTSHHQNNYGGAVRRLDQIARALAALDPATTPGFQLNGLKREELLAWNSMILHEIYFSGFGRPDAPAAPLAEAIERDFGSHDRWRAGFAAMGKALGGGSGWVLLTWSARDRRLVNQWAADHSMTLAGATPLLALDMYEHAYHIDYGANAGAYVDAFMKAIDWRAASGLYQRIAA
jgi:superoxide dismutase, Fe-Mn family